MKLLTSREKQRRIRDGIPFYKGFLSYETSAVVYCGFR